MSSLSLKRINRCDLFLLIWVLYYLQGIVYPEGGIISLALLGINLLVSACCAVKVLQWKGNPKYFSGLNMLILMFSVYGLLHILFNPFTVHYSASGVSLKSYVYIKSIYLSLLPIYPFYFFTKKGYLTEGRLKVWGIVFLASVTLSYFRLKRESLQLLFENGSSRDEITNNTGYLFLSCIPLLLLYRKKPIVQFALLAFVMAFVVMGMKRGAIAIGAIVSAYFIYKVIKNSRGKTKLLFIVLSAGLCIGAVYFFIYMLATSDYMMQRVQDTFEGNTSGRDNLYSFFWTYFTEHANFFQFLFGRGANGTLDIYTSYAHNDWLEIAVNQGMFGVVVYALYWIYFYKTWKHTTNFNAKTILAIVFVIFFSQTLFSMSYGDMTYVSTSVLGYALATVHQTND